MDEDLGECVDRYNLYLSIAPRDGMDEDLCECVGYYNLYLPIVPKDGMEEVFR